MTEVHDFRLNFRIRPDKTVEENLSNLATVINQKYKRDIDIVLRERRCRRG